MQWRARHWMPILFALVFGCDHKPHEILAPTTTALSDGVVARVSGEGVPPISIRGDEVARIARAQQISLVEARDRAISDALFASEATRQKKEAAHPIDLDSVLVRRLTEDFLAQAKSQGPLQDDEVEVITHKRWFEVARPEGFMTVTAVVTLPPNADPATEKRGAAVANAIRDVVLAIPATTKSTKSLSMPTSARMSEDPLTTAFRTATNSVKRDGFEVVVQQVAPVGHDNLSLLPTPFAERGSYEPSYVNAAIALEQRGDVAAVTRSRFGFHVIMLLARYPGSELSLEERRRRFEGEVYDLRAQKIADELLARLHKNVDVELEKNTDALLAEVHPSDRVMSILADLPRGSAAPPNKTSSDPSPP